MVEKNSYFPIQTNDYFLRLNRRKLSVAFHDHRTRTNSKPESFVYNRCLCAYRRCYCFVRLWII